MAPPDAILDLFETAQLVEFYSLGQVAYERVKVIEQLRRLISDEETDEKELQGLIETAPWILYPDWTPLSHNQSLATTQKNFESWFRKNNKGKEIATSTIGSPNIRPDFVMINHAGRLEIVEIKCPGHALQDKEFDRAHDYLDALRRFIGETDPEENPIRNAKLTIICDRLNLHSWRPEHIDAATDISHRTWFGILDSSSRIHEDFLAVAGRFQGKATDLSEEIE